MPDTETAPARLRRWAGRHHPVVWWVVVLKLTLALALSLLIPFFRGPDEVLHFSMLRWYADNPGYSNPVQFTPVDTGLLATEVPQAGSQVRPPLQVADATPRPERRTLAELDAEGIAPGVPSNQLSQHPPLFYVATNAVTGVVAMVLPSDMWSWDRLALAYRWQSVLAGALLPLVASSAALWAGLRREVAAVAAASTLLVVQHTAIAAVLNSDTVVALLAGVAVAATLRWIARPDQRTWAIVGVIAAGLATSMKGTGFAVLAWVVLMVGMPAAWAWRHRLGDRVRARARLTTWLWVVVLALLGAWWQISQVVRFANPQPSNYRQKPVPDIDPTIGEFVNEWVTRVGSSFWGSPAPRTGVSLPSVLVIVLSVVTCALVALALIGPWRRRLGRLIPTALLGLVLVQVALMVLNNWQYFFRTETTDTFQGRYLFVLLVPLAVLIALGVGEVVRLSSGRARAIWFAVGFAAVGVAMHALIAVQMLERFWGPPGGTWSEHLEAVLAWSPLPTMLTWLLLVAPWGVAVAAVVTGVVRRGDGSSGPRLQRTPAAVGTPKGSGAA